MRELERHTPDGERYMRCHSGGHLTLLQARRAFLQLHAAIARLIDKGELAWDPVTDETTVTPEGELEAARVSRALAHPGNNWHRHEDAGRCLGCGRVLPPRRKIAA